MDLLFETLKYIKTNEINISDEYNYIGQDFDKSIKLFMKMPLPSVSLDDFFWCPLKDDKTITLFSSNELCSDNNGILVLTKKIKEMINEINNDSRWMINDGEFRYSENKFIVGTRDGRIQYEPLNYQNWSLNEINNSNILIYQELQPHYIPKEGRWFESELFF